MSSLKELSPSSIWHYFNEICQVPRPSKHEEKIIKYLENFAASHQLETRKDGAGNLVVKKSGNNGLEHGNIVVLQSHMDMVCEKNQGIKHDFFMDPIVPIVENGWVRAKGTTLGADCGIGMAASLAILAANNLMLPPIEVLFTVDE